LRTRQILTIGALTILVVGSCPRTVPACTPLSPPRFSIDTLRTGPPPRIAKASASMTRGDPTSREPCAGLSSLAIGLDLDGHDRIGLFIEPLGTTDPMDAKSEGYGIRPLAIDATKHVTLPFFADSHAMNFGLRLIPVSPTGVRGAPFDLWIREPALPGMAQFLFRNGWIIRSAVLFIFIAAAVILGVCRLRRRGRGLS
jgi:hypothetical protein